MTDYLTTRKDFSTQTVGPETFWSQARSVMLPVEGGVFRIVYRPSGGLNRPTVRIVSAYFVPHGKPGKCACTDSALNSLGG